MRPTQPSPRPFRQVDVLSEEGTRTLPGTLSRPPHPVRPWAHGRREPVGHPRGREQSTLRSSLPRAVALALLLLAACSPGGEERAREPEPTSSSTSTTVPVEDEVVAAYLGFWDAVYAGSAPPNPDHPDLARFATGGQLEHTQSVAADDQAKGIWTRRGEPPTLHNPRVVRVTATEAVVTDCWLDTDILYRPETGEIVDDDQVWDSGEFHLVREKGSWKLAQSDIRRLSEGETCDAD